jgi:CBS domain containing-hemolysin-like protein
MRTLVELFLAGASVLVLLLLSTLQVAYEAISDVGLHVLRGDTRAERYAFLRELLDHNERFHTTLVLGIIAAAVFITLETARFVYDLRIPYALAATFLVANTLLVVCRLIIPQVVARRRPERILVRLLPLFRPYYRLMSIVVLPLEALLTRARIDEDDEGEEPGLEDTIADIQALIDVGAEEGILAEADGQLIQSIVEIRGRLVNEVMTPRAHVDAVQADTTVREACELIVSAKHSRLPVYRHQIDNVEGVVYARDALAAWADGKQESPVTEIMRPAYFVPEIKPVAQLLEEMRRSRVQLALVIDEYGAVSGLITIEDLLEEIVGEIEDEDVDATGDDIVRGADGSVVVKGSTEIRKLELEFDIELQADDFTTVAGLVIKELGHLPVPGERLEFRGIEFEVLESDNRRINLLQLRHAAGSAAASE